MTRNEESRQLPQPMSPELVERNGISKIATQVFKYKVDTNSGQSSCSKAPQILFTAYGQVDHLVWIAWTQHINPQLKPAGQHTQIQCGQRHTTPPKQNKLVLHTNLGERHNSRGETAHKLHMNTPAQMPQPTHSLLQDKVTVQLNACAHFELKHFELFCT